MMNDLKNRAAEALSYLNDVEMPFYKKVKNTLSSQLFSVKYY
ncbi:MAG: hypothetical protein ACQETH_15765 [Candidatus Rifleibacteriota bacterium]